MIKIANSIGAPKNANFEIKVSPLKVEFADYLAKIKEKIKME